MKIRTYLLLIELYLGDICANMLSCIKESYRKLFFGNKKNENSETLDSQWSISGKSSKNKCVRITDKKTHFLLRILSDILEKN